MCVAAQSRSKTEVESTSVHSLPVQLFMNT